MSDVAVTPLNVNRGAGASFEDATAATDGNNYLAPNDGNTRLMCSSTAGSTVTVATPGTVDGLAISDLTLTVPDGDKIVVFGPFPPNIYGAVLSVTVSAATSIAALKG